MGLTREKKRHRYSAHEKRKGTVTGHAVGRKKSTHLWSSTAEGGGEINSGEMEREGGSSGGILRGKRGLLWLSCASMGRMDQ